MTNQDADLGTRISDVVVQCMKDRRALAARGYSFTAPIANAVEFINSLSREIYKAHQDANIYHLVSSYLELTLFQRLVNGRHDLEGQIFPRDLLMREVFARADVLIPLHGRLNSCKSPATILPELTDFVSRLNNKHGQSGIAAMQFALIEFITRHPKTEANDISIRGGHAGVEDDYETAKLREDAEDVFQCTALFFNDVESFQRVNTPFGDLRRISQAEGLIAAGETRLGLRWLNVGTFHHSASEAVLDLKILASEVDGDVAALTRNLETAFLNTFEVKYFDSLMEKTSTPKTRETIQSKLIEKMIIKAEQDLMFAQRAIRFWISLQAWNAVERYYQSLLGKSKDETFDPRSFVFGIYGELRSTGDLRDFDELVSSIGDNLPEVACGLLRHAAKHLLATNRHYHYVEVALTQAQIFCRTPHYHPSHKEFLENLRSEFRSRRRFQKWLASAF